MYKLIALDLDDTVLNSDHEVPFAVKQAIARARAAGKHVVVATGRSYRGCRHILDSMGVDGPVIAFGGAMIADHPEGTILHARTVPRDVALEIAAFAKEQGVFIMIFDGQDYYFETPTRYSEKYEKNNLFAGIQAPFDTLPLDCVFKCLIADDDHIQRIRPLAEAQFGERCNVAVSRPFFLEFNGQNITKAHALDVLAKDLGIRREEIIAVGDNYIDKDMIEYAGLGVAVSNAQEDIKAAADYIAPSNNDDGVAHVIYEYLLQA